MFMFTNKTRFGWQNMITFRALTFPHHSETCSFLLTKIELYYCADAVTSCEHSLYAFSSLSKHCLPLTADRDVPGSGQEPLLHSPSSITRMSMVLS